MAGGAVEPEGIEEDEHIRVSDGGPLAQHIRARLEAFVIRQFFHVQQRIEVQAIEIAKNHLDALMARRLGIGLSHGHGEASNSRMSDDQSLFHSSLLGQINLPEARTGTRRSLAA